MNIIHSSPSLLIIRNMGFVALLILSSISLSDVKAQDNNDTQKVVTSNSVFNHAMLEHNQDLRKLDIITDAIGNGTLQTGKFYIGAGLTAIADYQNSNTNSKFAYLMRHPTSNNEVGENVSEAVLHSAQILVAGRVTEWLAVYSEVLYDPEQSFGAGTITALGRNQLQLRKGYILISDQARAPIYLALGKMDANFGLTGSVSPFTNSTFWHAFGGLGYGATIGIKSNGINASFMAVQGGSQFRALHAPVDSTAVPSRLNNFVADLNYTAHIGDDADVMFGGSYVRGTSYCQGFPVVHFQPCGEPNGAMTAYGQINYGNRLTIKGGWAQTENEWPGTFNPNPPLNVFAASKVSSKTAGASFLVQEQGAMKYSISAEFSDFIAGPDGAPWERQNQYVLGLNATVHNSSRLFVEVFRTEGYAPLNFVSGGHITGSPELTHSDRDARSHGIVVGGMITL